MLGTVLVVENDTLYAADTCAKLRKMGCSTITVPAMEEMSNLRLYPDRYKMAVLDSVKSILQNQDVDVLIANLHLKDEALLLGGDYIGLEVLELVTKDFPGVSCILCTADPPENFNAFVERYNANIIRKMGWEISEDLLRSAVIEESLLHAYPIRRKIDGRPYEVAGVNARLYRQLHKKHILGRAFSGVKDFDSRLVKALAVGPSPGRVTEATALMEDLWNSEPGLPAFPLIRRLGTMEYDRAFWKGHRDHLVHQLLVYLLGLYLYWGSEQLRTAMEEQMSSEQFMLAWKIAALFHDLGYVFEVEHDNKSELYNQAFDELNGLRENCLFHFFTAKGAPILEEENREIRNKGKIFIHKVEPQQIRSLAEFGDEHLFDTLEPVAQLVHLGDEEDNLSRYWEYAMSNLTKDHKRHGYVDHGIAGALILLQQYRSLEYFIEQAVPVVSSSSRPVSKQTRDQIKDVQEDVLKCKTTIVQAAQAIALHNINVDNWDHNDAFRSMRLTLNQYQLSLQRSPLAFLLAMADALQSWDRPKYSMPLPSDELVMSQDLDMRITGQKMVVSYSKSVDSQPQTVNSIFARKLRSMARYMNEVDLRVVLDEADFH